MIELRFIERDGREVLQWRQGQGRLQTGWADEAVVSQSMAPVYPAPEEDSTGWEDVRLETPPAEKREG